MVTIKDLNFAFKKNEPLFSDLSLNMKTGRTYGLFGLNGAGKTTLLNHISGMLFPEKGECLVLDQPSRNRHPDVLKEIFLLPEQFDLPSMSAETYTKLHAPFYPDFNHGQLQEILNEFDINQQKKLPELSYGQRKKFLIAFALSSHAKLLLMDEPTNGLDIPSKSQFRKIMAASDLSDRCVVISTHQVRDLNTLIDHLTVLNNGKIIFQQSIQEIFDNLGFEKISHDDTRTVLFAEETFGGKAAILPKNESKKETEIDLELLFSGIIQETDAINNQFKTD